MEGRLVHLPGLEAIARLLLNGQGAVGQYRVDEVKDQAIVEPRTDVRSFDIEVVDRRDRNVQA